MPRWEQDSANLLREAAFELFDEHGFENTTVAQIAERAGVNRRTFFHHFADKAEVVFGGHTGSSEMVDDIVGQPRSVDPLGAAVAGLKAMAEPYEVYRARAKMLGRILAASPELRARELAKRGALVHAVGSALSARGVADDAISVVSWAAVAIFFVARDRWHEPGVETPLVDLIDRVHAECRDIFAEA